MNGYVIFDLDGCLSDDRWRRKYLPENGTCDEDYAAYHVLCSGDQVTVWSAFVETHKRAGRHIIFITARPRAYHTETLAWLHNQFGELESFALLMRPDGDDTPSPKLKVRLFEQYALQIDTEQTWEDVVAAYDDRADVLAAYGRCGVTADRLHQIGFVTPEPPVTAVPEILESMADTFRERNKVYADNYKNVARIMKILWPDGVPPGLPLTDQWHLFELIVVKLTRFAVGGLTHVDSIHDTAIYAAMIESILKGEQA